MKHYFLALALFGSTLCHAQSLIIEPSRTSGTAPLYVFFDATNSTGLDGVNDLPNADFSWDFDLTNNDPSGKWEVTKGMVAGHVFEEPGTYTVSCTMIARNGTVDIKEVEITVSAFSGTTYYVSNEGSDANDGLTEGTTWASANHAFSELTADTRILFRRGDTFDGIDIRIRNLTSGIKIIGAYGTGERPILINAPNNTVVSIDNCTDITAMDLHLIVNSHTDGTSNNANRGLRAEESTHALALRLEIQDAASFATYQDDGDELGVFDCEIHDIGTIGIFSSDSRRFSWVGNSIDGMRTVQPEHCIRIQGGEKQFVAHSTFTNIKDVKTSVTVRGDGQRHIMIYKNKMDRIIQVAPTDHNVIQFVSLATIEGNYIGQNPDYADANFIPSLSAINLISQEIVVRNNVFDGVRRGLTISVEHPDVIPRDIDVYNNTFNWRNVMDASGTSGTMVTGNETVNVTIRNNLMSAPSEGEMTIYAGDDNSNLISSDNIMSVSPGFVRSVLPGSAADENDISNFELDNGSIAIDGGALDVPVFFDQSGGKRYYGSAPDVGAFEFDDGGEVTNPDTSEERQPLSLSVLDQLIIYPNPSATYFSVNINADLVEMYDLNGRKVLETVFEKNIDISDLESGVYLVMLKNGGKKVFTGRLIKE